MLTIDGSRGEGGGQILRSALSLSVCLQKPFQIINIRGKRRKPGLLRQHLTCVNAAAEISKAKVSGNELGSLALTFEPGPVNPGNFRFAISTAGSSCLVFQTLVYPLSLAEGKSQLTLSGGTHNGLAPSYDYLAQSFLPIFRKLGFRVTSQLDRHGFSPAGGGEWRAEIETKGPGHPLVLESAGEVLSREAIATSAKLPAHVGERELKEVKKHLNWNDNELHAETVESQGPGNLLSLRLHHEKVSTVVEVIGEKNRSAERVARKAVETLKKHIDAEVPIDEHLADQLLLPLLFSAGGRFVTSEPSQHTLSNIDTIAQFTGVEIDVEKLAGEKPQYRITVPSLPSDIIQ